MRSEFVKNFELRRACFFFLKILLSFHTFLFCDLCFLSWRVEVKSKFYPLVLDWSSWLKTLLWDPFVWLFCYSLCFFFSYLLLAMLGLKVHSSWPFRNSFSLVDTSFYLSFTLYNSLKTCSFFLSGDSIRQSFTLKKMKVTSDLGWGDSRIVKLRLEAQAALELILFLLCKRFSFLLVFLTLRYKGAHVVLSAILLFWNHLAGLLIELGHKTGPIILISWSLL